MRGHRIRLAGVEYQLCGTRRPEPVSGRRLAGSEFRMLLVAHRSDLRLRSLLAELGEVRGERRRHHMHTREQEISRAVSTVRCYELGVRLRRVDPTIIGDATPLRTIPHELPVMFDEEPHWVEVCIVGEDDQPLPGVLCEINLPSGKVIRRSTNRLGMVRIEGISTPGACSLSLPEHHHNAWQSA